MGIVQALNVVSSQVWAILLIFLGIGCFAVADRCAIADVRNQITTAAIGLVVGGIAVLQHQDKVSGGPNTSNTTTTTTSMSVVPKDDHAT